MNQVLHKPDLPSEEMDLRELFSAFWEGKWIILIISVSCIVGGAIYALKLPNEYQATALLAPAQNEDGSRISGQLSGLASLAGVTLGGGDANKTTIAKEVMLSRAFLGEFIARHEIAVPLMAAESWNSGAGEWVYDRALYSAARNEWLLDENGESLAPSTWDLVKAFREQLTVSENKDNGMITVALTSLSPNAAATWLRWLLEDINEHMRAQDISDAESSVAYLEEKLKETSIAGMQQVFYQLIEQETRTIMLANAQREYVFKVIDPPLAPQEKAGPKRGLIVLLAGMLGLMLATIIIFFRVVLKTGRTTSNQQELSGE